MPIQTKRPKTTRSQFNRTHSGQARSSGTETSRTLTSLCHWGAFNATVEAGRLVRAVPWPGSGADPEMIGTWPEMVYSEQRIDRPYVRAGWLKNRERSDGAGRGREEMVPVAWEEALSLVAGELVRVRDTHGFTSIFGGSYGWSSAGRLHHARTQLRRFLGGFGGFTDQSCNYSWGAAQILLPHVLGDFDAVAGAATAWQTIIDHTDLIVAFGGLNPKNWRVSSGGAGSFHIPDKIAQARRNGVDFVVVSPVADDIPAGSDADWLAPHPNTDTALMLALCHELLVSGRADRDFLDRYCAGADEFVDYVLGRRDSLAKTPAWAAPICGLPETAIRELAERLSKGRVMLTASWSLQRARFGEQPYWALIALAALIGQIGLPGGGFTFGYGSMNAVGLGARRGLVPAMPTLPNTDGMSIPVARWVDMLERPGDTIPFNGSMVTLPDIRMIYWAGGNPYHHSQDLFRLERAWARPETIVVNEPWWTPTARRADIVLPATTTAERSDIGGTSRDPHVFYMPKLIEPVAGARNDMAIFADLAARLGFEESFTAARDEEGWLRHLWSRTEAKAREAGIDAPDFDRLVAENPWRVPPPAEPEIYLSAFRKDPEGAPLATPSGRIELASHEIARYGYADAPGHPAWLGTPRDGGPVGDGDGSADGREFALLSRQPARFLHSQLAQVLNGDGPAPVRINPEDAARHSVGGGDLVRLQSGVGACLATAVIDPGCRTGVLAMETGPWFIGGDDGLDPAGNPNAVTPDLTASSLSQACAAQGISVSLQRIAEP